MRFCCFPCNTVDLADEAAEVLQHRAADLGSQRPQDDGGGNRIKLTNGSEGIGFQQGGVYAATLCHHIGGALCNKPFQYLLLVLPMPPFQRTAGHGSFQGLCHLRAQPGGQCGGLQGQGILHGIGGESLPECVPHGLPVGVVDDPRQCLWYIAAFIGVGNIKHIAKFTPAGAAVQQGDPMAAPVDPTQGLIVPVVDTGHGGGVGTLAVDQQLVGEGIVVGVGGRPQEVFPGIAALGYLPDQRMGKRAYILIVRHSITSGLGLKRKSCRQRYTQRQLKNDCFDLGRYAGAGSVVVRWL